MPRVLSSKHAAAFLRPSNSSRSTLDPSAYIHHEEDQTYCMAPVPSTTMPLTTTTTFLIFVLLHSAAAVAGGNTTLPGGNTTLAAADLRALLRFRRLLGYPSPLTPLPHDLCSLPASASLAVSCDPSGHLSALHLSLPAGRPPTPAVSVLSALSGLPFLQSLSLPSLSLAGPLPASSFPAALSFLNLSGNLLSAAVPAPLLAHPALATLDLSRNALAAVDPLAACGPRLGCVDLTGNRIAGDLPECISSNASRVRAFLSQNCLASTLADPGSQRLPAECPQKPVAAAVAGHSGRKGRVAHIAVGAACAALGAAAVAAVVVSVRRSSSRGPATGLANADALADAKRRAEAARMGTFGAAPYMVFEEEEVQEMTGGFEDSNLLHKEQSDGEVKTYRGWLQNGAMVTIKMVVIEQGLSRASLRRFTDTVSKLQHPHLVGILGHCVVVGYNKTTIYLVSKHLSNGTLRSHLANIDWKKRATLKWPQRVAAVLGVARGIQFLHTCGIHGSGIKMENILMDEALTAKISNYAIPMPSAGNNNKGTAGSAGKEKFSVQDVVDGDREDVYQLGIILLEIITGKSTSSEGRLEVLILQLKSILTESITELNKLVDAGIHGTFTYESLRTATEMALSCLSSDGGSRPSIDDFIWHLQYSIQVQYACASSGSISVQSFTLAP